MLCPGSVHRVAIREGGHSMLCPYEIHDVYGTNNVRGRRGAIYAP